MPKRFGFLLLLASTISAFCASCRVPEPPLLTNPGASAVIYDPRTADAISDRFPEMKEMNDRYRTAAAEPVSVVGWTDEHATLEDGRDRAAPLLPISHPP